MVKEHIQRSISNMKQNEIEKHKTKKNYKMLRTQQENGSRLINEGHNWYYKGNWTKISSKILRARRLKDKAKTLMHEEDQTLRHNRYNQEENHEGQSVT